MSAVEEYQVDLDTFRGPLDLLLFLVKRDEIDILDIPIARVAEQFKRYLDVLQLIDVERAGDFLVMAATLMEIKSKLVLPKAPKVSEQPEEDPRRELVRQLLQYKRYKEATTTLEERADQQNLRFARLPPQEPTRATPTTLRPVELWDLVSAFGRLMRETLTNQPQTIVEDHTPLQVHMDAVEIRLREEKRVLFATLFTPPHTRSRLVGLFLAVLELAKVRRVGAEQGLVFGEIWLTLLESETPEAGSPGK